jgi:hypothetical protein
MRPLASVNGRRKRGDMSRELGRAEVIVAIVLPVVLAAAPQAAAQTVATSFPELQRLVTRGNTIHVTDATGKRTKGKLGELSPSTLELLVYKRGYDGTETLVPQARLGEDDIRQILVERRDPPWKGMFIGLAAVGGPWALVCSRGCVYGEPGGEHLIQFTALITTGIAAGIGTLVDAAMVQRTMVYYKAPLARSPSASVSPLLLRSGAGVQMAFRF